MKQIKVPKAKQVKVKFTGAASRLQPALFKDGDSYCCLLGPDPQVGVFGCGDTPEEAVQDWDNALKDHLSTAGPDDEVVQYVNIILSESDKPPIQVIQSDSMESHIASIRDPVTANQVRAFYHQFKQSKK